MQQISIGVFQNTGLTILKITDNFCEKTTVLFAPTTLYQKCENYAYLARKVSVSLFPGDMEYSSEFDSSNKCKEAYYLRINS